MSRRPRAYFFFPTVGLCANELPAADLEVELVLPSRKTAEAILAALGEVTRCGAPVCESALPAAVFDFGEVFELVNVLDALEAALAPVTFDFVILGPPMTVDLLALAQEN